VAANLNQMMNLGSESLNNSRLGEDITGHNISNAQTPGYSRQIVNLQTKMPYRDGNHIFGNGADLQSIARAHDDFLETQIRKETQHHSLTEGVAAGLADLESLFNPEMTSTIRDRLGVFQNSIRELSNFPEEPSVRVNLVEAGQALCQSFQTAFDGVERIQRDATDEIANHVQSINSKLKTLATLNQSIQEMEVTSTQANDLQDRRDLLVKELSALMDVQVYHDENKALVLRGPGGKLLVEGPHSAHLLMDPVQLKHGFPRVFVSDFEGHTWQEVTDKIKMGKLGGLVTTRDVYAHSLKQDLNALASQLANRMNQVHQQGYGLHQYEDTRGRAFFAFDQNLPPAKGLHVDVLLVNDPFAVSTAMSPRTSGDNIVANQMLGLFQEGVLDGVRSTFAEFYDKFVGDVGVNARRCQEDLKASKIVMSQLEGRRESVSGVSLDEEAANLLKYQNLFAASSRIVTTVDELFKTILDLKR